MWAGWLAWIAGLIAASAALCVSAADSAGVSADADETLASVVVTARRRTESAQDVPIPISAVSGQTLDRTGRFRLEDLNQALPSTNIQFNGPRQTSIALRGLGNNPANDALESSVGVYLDNVYLGRASMANIDLMDVSQVALLRGTQGTLFGKNTTAGVLSITTTEPSFTEGASVEGSYGTDDYYQLRAAANLPLLDEKLAARLAVARTVRDGFVIDEPADRNLNGYERTGGRGQLLWLPDPAFRLRLIGDYSEEHSDAGAFVLVSPGPDGGARYYAAVAAAGAHVVYDPDFEHVTIESPQHFDVRQGGISAEANWQLNDYQLTSVTAFRSWWFSPTSDGDYTDRNAITAAGQAVDDSQWTQELRLASPADRPLSYVVGAYYFDQHQSNLAFTQYGDDVQAITALQIGTAAFADGAVRIRQFLNTHSEALFGQASWKLASGWEFSLGLRETLEQKSLSMTRTSSGLAGFVGNPNFNSYQSGELTLDDDELSALASASYKFTPDILGYVSLGRGAKSGGINPTPPLPGLATDSLYVRPEVARDAELGMKANALSGRLTFDADLFWVQVHDYQATLLLQPNSGNSFVQVLANVGNVRTRGIETQLQARPADAIALTLAASYNDAVYLSYPDGPCPAEQLAPNLIPGQKVCDLSGRPLVGAPRWIVNPAISYRENWRAQLSGVLQADWSWRSTYYGSPDDSELARVRSFGIFNLRYELNAQRAHASWAISLWSQNLFNKRYVIGGIATAGRLYNYIATPGLPRLSGVTMRVDF